MGAPSAVISRNMYDEAKRYVETVLQEGVPLVDADYNDQMDSFYTQLRRVISNSIGDGARGVAFQITQNIANLINDFLILGGVDGDDGPEELFVKGFQAQLQATETYLIDGNTAPVSSAIIGNQLIDTAANYTPGSLVGKVLVPDLSDPGTFFTITANTDTTITCGLLDNLAAGANAGDFYRVKLTTPTAGPARLDLVYLDVYLDEINATEDPDLMHNIDGIDVEAMLRKKLVQRVFVEEGITLPITLPSGYTDADGNRHVQLPLATILRPGGNSQILNSMITDLRRKIFRLDEVDDRFVNVTGDTMTGPLVMEANIVMASGQKVTGICVIDGNALCPEVVQQRHFDRTQHLLGEGDVVPTFEQVNDPLDPDHFEVHDNRYYTKGEVDAAVGSNLLVNGGFGNGIDGWDNAIPHALSGAPQADVAQNVVVSTGLCGSSCGTQCGCHTLKVCIQPGSRLCYVCPVRQTVDCLPCGGDFLIIQTMCVSRGDDFVTPNAIVDMYSSCKFLGTQKIALFKPLGDKIGVEKSDGFVRLTNRITLPESVDKISITLCYEIVPKVDLPPIDYPYPYYQPEGDSTAVPKCEVGPAGLEFSVCAAQIRRISGLESAGSPETGCSKNSIPIIEAVRAGNIVEFTPGADQVSVLIERLEETINDVPDGIFPTDFPGVQFDQTDPTKRVDEIPLQIVALKTCGCFKECTDHGYSSNACTSVEIGKVIDRCSLPLVSLYRDRTKKIAYWGQSDAALMDADIVLVPAKYRLDPIVGINGNFGYAPDGVTPLPGDLEGMARDTFAKFGTVAFKIPPSIGCRNIWMDIVYLDEVTCLGVDPTSQEYTFFDSLCSCVQISHTQEISQLITDSCMDRMLPDDQFQGSGVQPLPGGYPEAISFEYCALPRLDRLEDQQNAFFEFRRETAACARAGGGYYVRVEITSKQLPLTVQWADVLPDVSHTLISGVMSDTLVFSSIGETIVREYVVSLNLAAVNGQIVGTGFVIGFPSSLITLTSAPTIIDPDCPTVGAVGFGSQNPNVFGRVFWAGGGRFDPIIPTDIGLWVTAYVGQGSAGGKSIREQYLIQTETVLPLAVSHVFHVGPSGTDGFAVGLPVWIFNGCFEDNPQRRVDCIDIEEENAEVVPDTNVTGLYGVVTAVNAILNTITVQFNDPPIATTTFTTLAKAEIMVAPDQSMGFYWEASPALAALLNGDPGTLGRSIMKWGYRFWNSTQNPCPGTQGASIVDNGDGGSFNYDIPGEIEEDILNPVDWIDLWCSPIRSINIATDVDPLDSTIHVCDICKFEPCDIIQIVDQNCTGREGGGTGYVGSVLSTTPDNILENCDDLHTVKGIVAISPPIPDEIVGCPGFDGFKVARRAYAFVKPDIARFAFSLTTTCDENGCPIVCGGVEEEQVCVDFLTGKFTFSPNIDVANPLICYRAVNGEVEIPNIPGIYFLRAIDKTGCKSPPSKPIRVFVGAGPITCLTPSQFADCFTGLSGTAPQGTWVGSPLGGSGVTTFDGSHLIQTVAGNSFAAIQSPLSAPPLVSSYTLQFKAKDPLAGFNGYIVYLMGADGKNKVTFSVNPSVISIRTSNSDPAPQYTTPYTPMPGVNRQFHMTVDGAGVPSLWIDGILTPLTLSGTVAAFGGNTPNTLVIFTSGPGIGPPPNVMQFDEVFVDGAIRLVGTTFCCPGQGGGPTPVSLLARRVEDTGVLSISPASGLVDLPTSSISFTLTAPTLVEISSSIFSNSVSQGQPDSGLTGRVILFDIGNVISYDMVRHTLSGNASGAPSWTGAIDEGSKGRRVLTLGPGTYNFKLQTIIDGGGPADSFNFEYPLVLTAKSLGAP